MTELSHMYLYMPEFYTKNSDVEELLQLLRAVNSDVAFLVAPNGAMTRYCILLFSHGYLYYYTVTL